MLCGVLVTGCATGPQADIQVPAQSESSPRAAEPKVSGMSLSTGSLQGGETLTLSGTDLAGVTRVMFGEVEAPIVAAAPSLLTVTAPRAAEYQPVAAPVTVFAGDSAVPADAELVYTWAASTPVDRQLEYAFRHWHTDSYNLAEYGTFNPQGGDCMNFVSQTLIARGLPMTEGWKFAKGGGHTQTWTFVPSFDAYLASHPELGFTRLTLEQRDEVAVGDIVVLDWNANYNPDHIQIVSAVEKSDAGTKILMVGHNLDSNWRDLDEAITVDHPGGLAWFWKVP